MEEKKENIKNNVDENDIFKKNTNNTENNDKKKKDKKYMPLIYRFWYSITDIDKYYFIAIEGAKRSLAYIIILTAIISIIITTAFVKETEKLMDSSIDFIEKNITNFTITNNKLILESEKKPIEIKLDRVNEPKIIINDETSENENQEIVNKYNGDVIFFGKEKIIFKINEINKTIDYKNIMELLNFDKISKEDIAGYYNNKDNLKETYSTMYVMLFVYFFAECFVSIITNVIAIALVGMIISRMLGMKFKFSALFSMSTASITLPIILAMIYALAFIFTGFTMKYFTVMFTIISYVYIIMALIDIYRNLVKISEN